VFVIPVDFDESEGIDVELAGALEIGDTLFDVAGAGDPDRHGEHLSWEA
jgi:hypothetical protein